MDKRFKSSKTEKIGLKYLDKNAKNILSVGISTGGSAEINMVKKAKNAQVIATTVDEKGLDFTLNIISELGYDKQVYAKLEDVAQPMEYEDEKFDYVYARLVLHYLTNQQLENALSEIYRVTKKGGKFYVVVRTPDEWELKVFPEENVYDEETGLTTHWQQGEKKIRGSRNFLDESKLTAFLEGAGFVVKKLKHVKEYLYTDYARVNKSKHKNSLIWCVAEKK